MKKLLAALTLSLLLILAACNAGGMGEMDHSAMSGDAMEGMGHDNMAGGEMEMMDAMGEGLQIIEIYGRAAPSAQPTGAFYMLISNGTDTDELLQSASVDLCGTIELHEMKMENDVMMMQEVPSGEIIIPAGKSVQLKPGGLHVMCIEKDGEFMVGDSIPVTLNFATAGTMTLDAEIREIGDDMNHGSMEDVGHGDDGE